MKVGKGLFQTTTAGPKEVANVASTAPKTRRAERNECSKQCEFVLVQRRMFTNKSNPLTDETEDAPGSNSGKTVVEETEDEQVQRTTQEVVSTAEAATDQKPMPPTWMPPPVAAMAEEGAKWPAAAKEGAKQPARVAAMAEEGVKWPAVAKEGAKQPAVAKVATTTSPEYPGALMQPQGTTNLGKNDPAFMNMTKMEQNTLPKESRLINHTAEEVQKRNQQGFVMGEKLAIVAMCLVCCLLFWN